MLKFAIPAFTLFSLLLITLAASGLTSAASAPAFTDTAFATTWNRIDQPVAELANLGRGYTWGPGVASTETITSEPYNGTTRKVQYFDKARMEITNPAASPNDLFYVTTGLLVKELVTGQRQDGDNLFTALSPSIVQVAGDPNDNGQNLIAPTYASFQNVVTFVGNQNGQPQTTGKVITARIDKAGTVSNFTPPENRLLRAYDDTTRHNIADVFVDFGNQNGLIWNGKNYEQGSVFFGNATYVLGRPVTEPYWIRAVVGGVEKDVMVQLFERRVLTYTPSNSAAFKVEVGNVGQHYYRWRYIENGSNNNNPTGTPTPTPPGSTPDPGTTSSPALQPGINTLLNLYNLPQLGAYSQTYMVSSHDPAAHNVDYSNYLYQEGNHYVIFDSQGAGAVYRIWMVSKPFATFSSVGRIQLYFDNETNPRVDLSVEDFFSGKKAPFLAPLVGNELVSSGGFFSYVPLPYAKRLKIATTGEPGYYQISYQKMLGQTQTISSFTGKEDYSQLMNVFSHPGADPKVANPSRQTIKGDGLLKGGSELSLSGTLKGPAVISSLKLKLDLGDPKIMSSTYIRIKWDGRNYNQVDAPLDYFFGSGSGEKRVAGLMAGIDPASHSYYFYFPMPFRSDARITLFNTHIDSVQAHWEIGLDPDANGTLINPNTGYFNATFKRQTETPAGQDYVLLNTAGRGRYVGTVLNIYGDRSSMEGNERTYIDGSSTPQEYGTGFEDYFNGAYAFSRGPFSLPLHGSPDKAEYSYPTNFVTLVGYRFLLGDTVSFNNSLVVGFEQGPLGKDIPAKGQVYTSLALWYGQETASMDPTDAIDVGESASERDHAYVNSGQTSKGQLTSSYEGLKDDLLFSDSGYRLSGGSEFTIKINPNNSGVILRRRFDYNDLNQQADIYVDGQLVGRWFSPGQNQMKRWRDEDFAIPASFTQGKTTLRVKIQAVVEPAPWSEFYYQVYSLKPGLNIY